MWTRYLALLSLLVILFMAISCGPSPDDASESETVSPDDVSSIAIPNRELGYQFLENTVIASSGDLDSFLQDLEDQPFWNDKDTFVSILQGEEIDWNVDNIIIFPHTEPSGSITVTPQEPVSEEGVVTIDILRDVPEVGTADMANYAFAYRVSKRIDKVIFVVDESRIEMTNESS